MGPDGGPYIAINENSGNIELEDNTGTTVAIWDDANSQWDFQNNPISNVDSLTSNSVNTESADIGGAVVLDPSESITTKLNSMGAGAALIVPPGTYNETFEFQADEQTVFAVGDVIVNGGSDRGWEQGLTTDVTDCRVTGVYFQSSGDESLRIRSGSTNLTASHCRFETTSNSLAIRANFIASNGSKFSNCYFLAPTNSDVINLQFNDNNSFIIGSKFDAPASADTIEVTGDNNMVATNIIEGTLADGGTNNETTPNVNY